MSCSKVFTIGKASNFWLDRDREKTKPIRTWFCNVLNAADPDPYRIRLRKLLLNWSTFEVVDEMQNPEALASLPTIQLIIDGTDRARYEEKSKLIAEGYWKKRHEFLSAAYLKYPGEFSINFVLARHCMGWGLNRRELDLPKAVEHLLVCYAMEPECAGVLTRMMDAYTRLKDVEQATIFGQRLVQLYPQMSEAHFIVALYSSLLGLNDEAIEAAKRSIELNPEFVESYTLLCRIYLERREFDLATKYAQAVVKVRPENRTARYWAEKVAKTVQEANRAANHAEAGSDSNAGETRTR